MYIYLPLSIILGDWDKNKLKRKQINIYHVITEVLYFHKIEINPLISIFKGRSTITFVQGYTYQKAHGLKTIPY